MRRAGDDGRPRGRIGARRRRQHVVGAVWGGCRGGPLPQYAPTGVGRLMASAPPPSPIWPIIPARGTPMRTSAPLLPTSAGRVAFADSTPAGEAWENPRLPKAASATRATRLHGDDDDGRGVPNVCCGIGASCCKLPPSPPAAPTCEDTPFANTEIWYPVPPAPPAPDAGWPQPEPVPGAAQKRTLWSQMVHFHTMQVEGIQPNSNRVTQNQLEPNCGGLLQWASDLKQNRAWYYWYYAYGGDNFAGGLTRRSSARRPSTRWRTHRAVYLQMELGHGALDDGQNLSHG